MVISVEGIPQPYREGPSINILIDTGDGRRRGNCGDAAPRRDDWSLCGAPLVPMMETADFGDSDNPSSRRRLDGPVTGSVLLQPEMRSTFVVQVDNPTHIILSYEKSVIRGTHGSVAVAMYEVLVKQGQSLCRCGLEEERNRRAIEIPTWMFEPAACCRLRVMVVPTVGCDALLELKALRTVPCSDPGVVLQAQHRSLLAAGGADATVPEPTATFARPGATFPARLP
jgi:hypothetical protein